MKKNLFIIMALVLGVVFLMTPGSVKAADNMCNVNLNCDSPEQWIAGWFAAREPENVSAVPQQNEWTNASEPAPEVIRVANEDNSVNRSQIAADDAAARGGDPVNPSTVTETTPPPGGCPSGTIADGVTCKLGTAVATATPGTGGGEVRVVKKTCTTATASVNCGAEGLCESGICYTAKTLPPVPGESYTQCASGGQVPTSNKPCCAGLGKQDNGTCGIAGWRIIDGKVVIGRGAECRDGTILFGTSNLCSCAGLLDPECYSTTIPAPTGGSTPCIANNADCGEGGLCKSGVCYAPQTTTVTVGAVGGVGEVGTFDRSGVWGEFGVDCDRTTGICKGDKVSVYSCDPSQIQRGSGGGPICLQGQWQTSGSVSCVEVANQTCSFIQLDVITPNPLSGSAMTCYPTNLGECGGTPPPVLAQANLPPPQVQPPPPPGQPEEPPAPTPTPPPPPAPICTLVRLYAQKDGQWVELQKVPDPVTETFTYDPPIGVGSMVRLTVTGAGGTFTSARFSVNGGGWLPSTGTFEGAFYVDYQIPTTGGTFEVAAQVFGQ